VPDRLTINIRAPGGSVSGASGDFTCVNRSPVDRGEGVPTTRRYVPVPRPLGMARQRTEAYR
jgi:hypothetical protein